MGIAGDQWPDPAGKATLHLRAVWSFSHFPMGPENPAAVQQAAAKGLVVNASIESRSVAAALVRRRCSAIRACALWPALPACSLHSPDPTRSRQRPRTSELRALAARAVSNPDRAATSTVAILVSCAPSGPPTPSTIAMAVNGRR